MELSHRCRFCGTPWILWGKFRGQLETPNEVDCPRNPPPPLCTFQDQQPVRMSVGGRGFNNPNMRSSPTERYSTPRKIRKKRAACCLGRRGLLANVCTIINIALAVRQWHCSC